MILCTGNSLYTCINNYIKKNVPKIVSLSDKIYYLQYSDSIAGDLFMANNNEPFYFLLHRLHALYTVVYFWILN